MRAALKYAVACWATLLLFPLLPARAECPVPSVQRDTVRSVAAVSAAPASVPASAAASAAEEVPSLQDRYLQRGIIEMSNVFVPRGQWILGSTLSYSTHDNDNYDFFIIEGIESSGYTFRVSPMLAYALRNNMALGARVIYSRTNLMIDSADLKFGDDQTGTEIRVDEYKSVKHSYTVAAIWRQYIPLGRSKRFALFNEVQLGGGGTQSKFASGQPVKGTYESGYTLSLGIAPGLLAFATNDVAIEVNVGVMGISYTNVRQVHNQVSVGRRSTSSMNFKVNIFSIGVGVSFYL